MVEYKLCKKKHLTNPIYKNMVKKKCGLKFQCIIDSYKPILKLFTTPGWKYLAVLCLNKDILNQETPEDSTVVVVYRKEIL